MNYLTLMSKGNLKASQTWCTSVRSTEYGTNIFRWRAAATGALRSPRIMTVNCWQPLKLTTLCYLPPEALVTRVIRKYELWPGLEMIMWLMNSDSYLGIKSVIRMRKQSKSCVLKERNTISRPLMITCKVWLNKTLW
jgi:hypothetical protein